MGVIESHIKIVNNTYHLLTTSVTSCSNYDWPTNERPDRNFQGVQISSRQSEQRMVKFRKEAKHCPFTMSLKFSDGTADTFRIHQKHVNGCCSGFQHLQRSHDITYVKEGNVLVITVLSTQQQQQEEIAKNKNKTGEAKMKEKKYAEAIKWFDAALASAKENSTINSIKSNKSDACKNLGNESLQKALDLERNEKEDKSAEAKSKFEEAKKMHQEAVNLKNNAENQKNLKLTAAKIEGNRLFNEASALESQAFKLFEGARASNNFSDCTSAQNKYKEALAKYEQAVKEFEKCAQLDKGKFDDSVQISKTHVQEVRKVIEDIDKVELGHNISEINIEEGKNDKEEQSEVVNTNLQEQVDVVTN